MLRSSACDESPPAGPLPERRFGNRMRWALGWMRKATDYAIRDQDAYLKWKVFNDDVESRW